VYYFNLLQNKTGDDKFQYSTPFRDWRWQIPLQHTIHDWRWQIPVQHTIHGLEMTNSSTAHHSRLEMTNSSTAHHSRLEMTNSSTAHHSRTAFPLCLGPHSGHSLHITVSQVICNRPESVVQTSRIRQSKRSEDKLCTWQ
jgi:hypothetical protein